MVLTDSSRARSMKAQVLTTRQSAASAADAISWPASVSMPSISSESTWFLGHPSVVKWTFMAGRYDPTATPAPSTSRRRVEGPREGTAIDARGFIRYPACDVSQPDDRAHRCAAGGGPPGGRRPRDGTPVRADRRSRASDARGRDPLGGPATGTGRHHIRRPHARPHAMDRGGGPRADGGGAAPAPTPDPGAVPRPAADALRVRERPALGPPRARPEAGGRVRDRNGLGAPLRGRGRCDRRDLDRPRRRRARRRARPVDAARPLARSRPGPGPSRSRRLANPKLVPRRAGSRRRAGPEVFVLSLCARGEYSIGLSVAVSRSADRGVVPAPRGAGDQPRRRAALGVRRDPATLSGAPATAIVSALSGATAPAGAAVVPPAAANSESVTRQARPQGGYQV